MNWKLKIFTLLFFTNVAFCQVKYNTISLEANYGYTSPMGTYSDFSGANHFTIGARYMYNLNVGIKIAYAHDSFTNTNLDAFGTKYNRIDVQGYLNAGRLLFDLPVKTHERIGLLTHGGLGYSLVRSKYLSRNEQVLNLIVGITPQVKLTDNLCFTFDTSLHADISQDFNYNGDVTDNLKKANGVHLNFSVGIQFYLGNKNQHADWY